MDKTSAEEILNSFKDMVVSKIENMDEEKNILRIRGTELYSKSEHSSSTFYAIGGWDFIEDRVSYVKYGKRRDGKILVNVKKAREEHGL